MRRCIARKLRCFATVDAAERDKLQEKSHSNVNVTGAEQVFERNVQEGRDSESELGVCSLCVAARQRPVAHKAPPW